MGARRKTAAELEASGANRKHPERFRGKEPTPTSPVGNAPDYLDESQAACWRELVGDCPPGVLTRADRTHLAMTAALLSRFRDDPAAFSVAEHGKLSAHLAKLAMSPADRTRVSLPVEDTSNVFDVFKSKK